MAEYTKIETVRAIICDMCKCLYPGEDCPEKCDWMEYLKEDAADVAPVVRCYQCRSYNKPRLGWCSFHMDRENYDDFCSYGVRKDGDSDALD